MAGRLYLQSCHSGGRDGGNRNSKFPQLHKFKDSLGCLCPFLKISKQGERREKEKREEEIEEGGPKGGFLWPFLVAALKPLRRLSCSQGPH